MMTWREFRRTDRRRRHRHASRLRIALASLVAALAGSCSVAGGAPVPVAGVAAPSRAMAGPAAPAAASVAPTALSVEMLAELANVSPPAAASPSAPAAVPAAPAVPEFAGPAARAFGLAGRGAIERMRAHLCLASALYYEADSESDDGERAVAQVVLNRVRHPAFPASVCGVVYQGSETPLHCQFSFACDGSMTRRRVSGPGWARASRIADAALDGAVFKPVGLAINYHTVTVAPRWSSLLVPAAVIGRHIFYRLSGPAGVPAAFAQAYARSEPMPGPHPQLVAAMSVPAMIGPVASALPVVADASPAAPAPKHITSAPATPPITPDDQILPQWRDSGRWIAH